MLVFPTPELPMISNLAKKSCWDMADYVCGERMFIYKKFIHKLMFIMCSILMSIYFLNLIKYTNHKVDQTERSNKFKSRER